MMTHKRGYSSVILTYAIINISKHIKAPLNVDQHQERARGDYMELKYPRVFRPHKKGARKEGIMLSEASVSLYFECPKKGAEKGQKRGRTGKL